MLGKNLIQAASGAAGAAGGLGIEDVFSTWLYSGNSSTQTITNGIDLAGEGGLVWIKDRSYDPGQPNGGNQGHTLWDTERGATKRLSSHLASAQSTLSTGLTAFNADGFSLGNSDLVNYVNYNWASWTFRKAPGFFDVVTYTGTGSTRTVAHNLGSVPGTIIIKRTDGVTDWPVYHRSLGTGQTLYLNLNGDGGGGVWAGTSPTSTEFTLSSDIFVNASGGTYVAYLFAHDAGGFGDSGNESIIKCGSYTNLSSQAVSVDLGWEPQWLLIKNSNASAPWVLVDNMRGMAATTADNSYTGPKLWANDASAESNPGNAVQPTATGFKVNYGLTGDQNAALTDGTRTYIYIAIRRPMKTPTSATEVFETATWTGDGTGSKTLSLNFSPDMSSFFHRTTTDGNYTFDRLRGNSKHLRTHETSAEGTFVDTAWGFDKQNAIYLSSSVPYINGSGANNVAWNFRRAPGFFDVICWTGTGVNPNVLSHNLGVSPQLIISKRRSTTGSWDVSVFDARFTGGVAAGYLNADNNFAQDTFNSFFNSPTASTVSVTSTGGMNASGTTNVTYLFATLPGISKVGSYTGTGTTLDVDCGFTSGARFVLIKRTDSAGDWYVWDTARGIVSGNDPYLLLNSTAAEVTSTDYIDPLSSGFQISSTAPAAINANGGSYIFLAIA